MPFLVSFALEPETMTLAWIANASVHSRSTFMQLKGESRLKTLGDKLSLRLS